MGFDYSASSLLHFLHFLQRVTSICGLTITWLWLNLGSVSRILTVPCQLLLPNSQRHSPATSPRPAPLSDQITPIETIKTSVLPLQGCSPYPPTASLTYHLPTLYKSHTPHLLPPATTTYIFLCQAVGNETDLSWPGVDTTSDFVITALSSLPTLLIAAGRCLPPSPSNQSLIGTCH